MCRVEHFVLDLLFILNEVDLAGAQYLNLFQTVTAYQLFVLSTSEGVATRVNVVSLICRISHALNALSTVVAFDWVEEEFHFAIGALEVGLGRILFWDEVLRSSWLAAGQALRRANIMNAVGARGIRHRWRHEGHDWRLGGRIWGRIWPWNVAWHGYYAWRLNVLLLLQSLRRLTFAVVCSR